MRDRAQAADRGRDHDIHAEQRERRVGEVEVEQDGRTHEERARQEFADLFPIDGALVEPALIPRDRGEPPKPKRNVAPPRTYSAALIGGPESVSSSAAMSVCALSRSAASSAQHLAC